MNEVFAQNGGKIIIPHGVTGPWVFRYLKSRVVNTIKSLKNPKSVVKVESGSKFGAIKTGIKSTDMFAFSPVVQFNSYKTLVGGISSMLCLSGK